MRVLEDAPPAAGSLDPWAMQVNPLPPRQHPAPQVVLVRTRTGAHNGAVVFATLSPPERTHSGLPR